MLFQCLGLEEPDENQPTTSIRTERIEEEEVPTSNGVNNVMRIESNGITSTQPESTPSKKSEPTPSIKPGAIPSTSTEKPSESEQPAASTSQKKKEDPKSSEDETNKEKYNEDTDEPATKLRKLPQRACRTDKKGPENVKNRKSNGSSKE